MPADLTPTPPRTGDGLLQIMARSIFAAGLSWDAIQPTWPATKRAFEHFAVRKVCAYGDGEVARILRSEGVIGNERKIRWVIGAAGVLEQEGHRHGSARKWLAASGDHAARVAALTEIPGIGSWGAYYVLAKCGYTVPPWRD